MATYSLLGGGGGGSGESPRVWCSLSGNLFLMFSYKIQLANEDQTALRIHIPQPSSLWRWNTLNVTENTYLIT